MTWYANNPSILRRWAALSENPLPESFAEYTQQFTSESMEIRRRDPELASILEGTCNAALKADVLEGKFDPVGPTEEQLVEAAKTQQLQELYESKPFEPGTENLTAQMMMRALSPELADQQQAAATPDPGRPDLTAAQIASAKAAEDEVRRNSLLKGMAMSKAQYDRQRVRRQMIQMHVADMNRIGQGDD